MSLGPLFRTLLVLKKANMLYFSYMNGVHVKVRYKHCDIIYMQISRTYTIAQAGDCEEMDEIHSNTQRSWCQSSNSPQ